MAKVTGLDIKLSLHNPSKYLSNTDIATAWDEAQNAPGYIPIPVAFAHLIEMRLFEIIDSSPNMQKAIKLAVEAGVLDLK